nr:MAG: hypothetical protein DiTV3a_F2ORF19 [Diabrotica toursvirus 3a]
MDVKKISDDFFLFKFDMESEIISCKIVENKKYYDISYHLNKHFNSDNKIHDILLKNIVVKIIHNDNIYILEHDFIIVSTWFFNISSTKSFIKFIEIFFYIKCYFNDLK